MAFDAVARIFLSIQHKVFYIVMAFARFNLYANSYIYLYQKSFDTKRARGGAWAWRLEVMGIVTFWTWYTRVLLGTGCYKTALAYFLISNMIPSPLHVQVRDSLTMVVHAV